MYGVLGEQVGHFPGGEPAVAEVMQEIPGDLGEMGFVADLVFLRHGQAPGVAFLAKSHSGIFGLEGVDGFLQSAGSKAASSASLVFLT